MSGDIFCTIIVQVSKVMNNSSFSVLKFRSYPLIISKSKKGVYIPFLKAAKWFLKKKLGFISNGNCTVTLKY